MTTWNTEIEAVDFAHRVLLSNGILTISEVSALGRMIDLVFLDGNKVCSVEFKKQDWKTALKQSRDHRLVADLSYICTPRTEFGEGIIRLFRDCGVGILSLQPNQNWPFVTILEAQLSDEIWQAKRKQLISRLFSKNKELSEYGSPKSGYRSPE